MKNLTKLEKSWILYDVGNSAFILMATTIIPIYFKNMASASGVSLSDSTAYWGYASSLVTIIVGVLAPPLGAIADTRGYKKPLFSVFLLLGMACCAILAVPSAWPLFLAIFILANIGFSASLVFYDSMLTDITTNDRMDMVSSHGYAWGYIGSCIPFAAGLLLVLFAGKLGISSAEAAGSALVITAGWWGLVTVPLLKDYRQVYFVEADRPVAESMKRIGESLRSVRKEKNIFLFLLAFFFYIDGVDTIISMASSYGKDVGIDDNNLLLALLVTQIVAFPCSLIFGRLSKRVKTNRLISVCIGGYFFLTLFALQLDKAWEFWFLALWVAVFQGGIQALSRSYYAKIVPKTKSNEYFGFIDIFGKGAAFFGTGLMAVSTQLFGTSKAGVCVIALMFLAGFFLFRRAVREPALKDEQIAS